MLISTILFILAYAAGILYFTQEKKQNKKAKGQSN
jgi:hypothetical protein